MKKVTFYYVRHGETLFNQEGRMQGFCDSPLTEKGISQAQRAREILLNKDITVCYSSTSERCIDTAHIIIHDRNIPIYYEKDLKEINFGTYEGARIENHFEEIDHRRRGSRDWTDVGGENHEQVIARVHRIYNKIFDSCKDGDSVVVVSHGAIFMQLFDEFFGQNVFDVFPKIGKGNPVPNGYVCCFERVDDKYSLVSINSN